MKHEAKKSRVWGAILTLVLVTFAVVLFARNGRTSGDRGPASIAGEFSGPYAINKDMISAQIGTQIRNNEFPDAVDLSLDGGTQHAVIGYTIDESSQAWMERTIGQYKPDYAAFVAMDARTGRVLSLVSYSASEPNTSNLTMRATFPAASIFKVVTASAALDLDKANPETVVPFNGANHTLYKKNVQDTRVNRWTRMMTMKEAFARSVNVFFGKLGLFIVGPQSLKTYAERYMFDQPIHSDFPVDMGHTHIDPSDPWSVVQAASGFTRETTMSPLQGAMMAAAVANDGVMMEPYIVDELTDDRGIKMYEATPKQASVVIDPDAAAELRKLFNETVRSGTGRKSFRKTVRRSAFDDVEFGGKTGSLTGLNPAGKCDWFIGYARYHGERIAVAGLTVNEKKWKVKSSMLANLFFTHYLKEEMAAEKRAKDSRSVVAN
jgi:cell division protein FtsI/penicillin-binding protein 2